MKILNLYAGIGGNRKLWGDEYHITAVEHDSKVAEIYQDFYPDDTVVIGDAHQYLIDNYRNFDFIWSSPPCPTHSDVRRCGVQAGNVKAVYPDMCLYQEIILLQNFYDGGYCVENVVPYYKPLIPAQKRERHLFWANFYIPEMIKEIAKHDMNVTQQQKVLDMDISKYKGIDKRKVLRNCVLPSVGLAILNSYINQQPKLL